MNYIGKLAWSAKVPGSPKINPQQNRSEHEAFVTKVCDMGKSPKVNQHTYILTEVYQEITHLKWYIELPSNKLNEYNKHKRNLEVEHMIIIEIVWHDEQKVVRYYSYLDKNLLMHKEL